MATSSRKEYQSEQETGHHYALVRSCRRSDNGLAGRDAGQRFTRLSREWESPDERRHGEWHDRVVSLRRWSGGVEHERGPRWRAVAVAHRPYGVVERSRPECDLRADEQ